MQTEELVYIVATLTARVTWLDFRAAYAHDKAQGPISLKPFLKEWWDNKFMDEMLDQGNDSITVPCNDFIAKLYASLCEQ